MEDEESTQRMVDGGSEEAGRNRRVARVREEMASAARVEGVRGGGGGGEGGGVTTETG